MFEGDNNQVRFHPPPPARPPSQWKQQRQQQPESRGIEWQPHNENHSCRGNQKQNLVFYFLMIELNLFLNMYKNGM